jgi:hypothetical protein
LRRSILLFLLIAVPAALPEPIILWKSTPELVAKCAHSIPASNAERLALLRKLFQSAECRDKELEEQPVAGSEQKNLICTMEGKTGPVILITADYELEGKRKLEDKGVSAVEDWSGAVLLPLISNALHATVPQHTFVLAELAGKRGAKAFLASRSKQQRRNIVGVIGLDALGVGPVRFWISPHDDGQTFFKERRMAMVLMEASNILKQPEHPQFNNGATTLKVDETSEFRRAGIPTLLVHSLNPESRGLPRPMEDTAQAIDSKIYYDSYLLLCAYFGRLDQTIDGSLPRFSNLLAKPSAVTGPRPSDH